MLTIDFAGISFEGPLPLAALPRVAGLYAVLGVRSPSGYPVIDIGESEDICARVQAHDRKDCWERHGAVAFAAHQMARSTKEERLALESLLRKNFNPSCGQR
jgi:hypothetical protein